MPRSGLYRGRPRDRISLRREALAVARQGWLTLRAVRRPRRHVGVSRVAVFVHGFGAAGPVFDPMRARVERELDIATVDFSYGPFSTFESIAERFERHVERCVPPDARISLVGHSLGGLIARWYVQEQVRAPRVDHVVTLATPHAGTRSARFAPVPVAESLKPGSPLIERLSAGRHRARDAAHFALVAGADVLCSPPHSAASLDGAEVVWIDDLGHNELLFDERVHALVVHALR